MTADGRPYGLIAEFDGSEPLLEAARRARAQGYRRIEAFSPVPVPGLAELLGERSHWVPFFALGGAIIGAGLAYLMQYWVSVQAYPLNVGGRPLHSWPSFVPIAVVLAILGASVAAVAGMLALNRLPGLHHPVFDTPDFNRASDDRHFLCIRADDPAFDPAGTRRFLEDLAPLRLTELTEPAR